MAPPGDWSRAGNILCVRLDSLGDVLMTTPAIRALKEGGGRITLLTSPSGAAAVPFVPELDEVIVYEAPWMKAPAHPSAEGDLAMVERIRAMRFDAAVIFTVFSQNPLPAAMLCHLAGIPLRLAHCRENPYRLLTNWVPEPEPERFIRHEVRRQLDLVASAGFVPSCEGLSFAVPPEALQHVRSLLSESLGLATARFIVVHPGSTAASRRYPPELFAKVLRQLHAQSPQPLVLTGAAAETELVRSIGQASGVPVLDLAGKLDLAQLGALLSLASVLVANNTGPVHIASAVATPVVDIYALTNPQHTPWATPSRVLSNDVPCRWCYKSVCPEGHHLCLAGVTPESVVAATLELLSERGNGAAVAAIGDATAAAR